MNSMTDFFKSKLKQKVAVGKREREEEAFCDEGLRKRKEMAFLNFRWENIFIRCLNMLRTKCVLLFR